ncbi:quinate 5-dehydrogenase [Heliobacillus mobilis]|uniref:Quinate 5-dehydrogenase n=1 Tax=Heliobacterium mobile TaxID=28064 RepID=A0A6I3SP94_HELMO|nr:quinate 5-dehydrogenase [Heliobacterium mobile]MTV50851.1 quinate 5-dehydrogenase [Heliobacterium mobile]
MKHVVSVSLGSSRRNHQVELNLLGETVCVERIGVDGDMRRAVAAIEALDGRVDAIGLGGIDRYLRAGHRQYVLRDGEKLAQVAKVTPVVDGSGLKDTLERRTVETLAVRGLLRPEQKVLMVCAVDRYGLAEGLVNQGCRVTFGDLMFGVGLPLPLRSLEALNQFSRVIIPVVSLLPFHWLYPTGRRQESCRPRFSRAYEEADVVAGDFHYIRRYMPADMRGKILLTNTVTAEDVEMLKARGVSLLITTTPELDGRSFGTNVMEGLLVALSGRKPEELGPEDYHHWLDRLGFQPRMESLDSRQTTIGGRHETVCVHHPSPYGCRRSP